ncbi:uncharacterized protein LOC132310032 [Cornus florida]|uniref:uncharacterized protein LOC132310032 n=1 Tax=Cornus florida TaxID=4283 RepID=UPI002896B3F0|nr:uncharacterized protein LOC132310032 [Cornus florida]
MVKAFASYNDDVAKIVLKNAPKNAKYTSPQIQKEILHILSTKVRNKIREDIGDAKFCILVDEACDEFKREQLMAFVLRYVEKDGFLQECFFDLVHVKDITSLNFKKDLCVVLSHYNLDVHNLRGQGYDGASNMRGEWNDLDELEIGRGANQIGTLQRPGDTRWSSHFDSVCNLLRLFGPTCLVLENIIKDGSNYKSRGDADTAFNTLRSFQFSEKAMKLITLSSALDPRDGYKLFNVEDICTLVDEFYPQDFMGQERIILTFQLQHYKVEVLAHSHLKNMSTIFELCRGLVIIEKSKIYFLIDMLIRLVWTLPVSTATTERVFSTMKLVKTQLRNRMEDEFLADYLSISIEKEIAQTFSTDSIIDDFSFLKDRRTQFL